ncbi:MAG: hypothetical protein HS102_18865 [Planctomycetia bacterium]|nr:hypothetical protein [Planctomycetia bacterium]
MSYAIGSRAARTRTALVGAAVLALSVVMPPAWANDGIQADLTVLTFTYQVINPNAQEGEVIGRISVVDGALSVSDILKLDLGGDGQFGGGDDTALDLAEIDDSGQFDVFFGGDVVKLAGPNNYEILGGIWTTDLTTNVAIRGKLTTSYVSLGGRVFSIIGIVSPETGEDSLLVPGPGDSWVFSGSPADTNGSPNEDGVVGTVTVPTGRSLYTEGNIVEFHFAFDGNSDLDAYFKQNRSASSSDIKLVIPRGDEPPVLGACCLPDGSCAEITRDECEARGGTYKGDNVPCDNHTCAEQGACCLPDGTCEELFQDECEARGGTYKGDNVPCDNHTCAEQGACCLPDGTCEELFQDECEARGGTYKGDNVPCDADTCAPPTGACCLPGGDDCDENVCDNGKPKSLTFLYTGSDCRNPDNNNDQDGEFTCSDDWNSDPIPVNPVRIRVTSKRDPFDRYGKVWFDGTVYVGQEFTASAANAGQSRLYSDTYITIIDRNNYCKTYQCIHIDTSCCEELRLNDVFGSVKLVAFTTETGYSADADDCNAGGGCEELSEEECEARGGTYNGDGTECTDDTCVEPCDILCPPDVEACAACGECSVDDLDLGRPTLDGDCDGAVITNDAPDEFPIGVTIVTWTVTVGNRTSTCTQKVTVDGTICGMKWYDKDVDGVKDSNEGGINGWRIELRDANGNLVQKVYTKTIDCKEGRYEFCCVAPGTYTVLEVMPNNDWVATTPTSYTVTVGDGSCDLKRDFGNVCLGGGCARTIGYWGNSQGKSKINDGGSANPELSMLRALNLRKSDGAHFDPTGVDSFQSWLRGANATNMAYMLSAQLSAMALNVEGGYVSENDVVYAPGVGNRGPGNHFITIADLMAAADRAPGDGLGADGYTPSGDPNRAVQELRKNALDAANNNEAFVNREPCCFQSPY